MSNEDNEGSEGSESDVGDEGVFCVYGTLHKMFSRWGLLHQNGEPMFKTQNSSHSFCFML
jgi:hypothetical protein